MKNMLKHKLYFLLLNLSSTCTKMYKDVQVNPSISVVDINDINFKNPFDSFVLTYSESFLYIFWINDFSFLLESLFSSITTDKRL